MKAAPTIERTTSDVAVNPPLRLTLAHTRLTAVIAIFAMVIGVGALLGGVAGAVHTWNEAAAQDITTPEDAPIAEAPVRGPLTMWSQAEIIEQHQLESTDGLYYSQMERLVPQVDENGEPVLEADGEPVMVPNEARAGWVTATALTTSLGLGILAYAVSAFAIVVGLTLLGLGWVVLQMRRVPVALS